MIASPGPPAASHNATFFSPPKFLTTATFKPPRVRPSNASIKPPPSGFDFRSPDILGLSSSFVDDSYPELSDLAAGGSLVRIEKKQFGPVPEWRSEFVEPEEIWLVGTNHISRDSSKDVERVVKTLTPDNVVVELCRSRQRFIYRAGIMYTSDEGMIDQQLRGSMFSLSGSEFFSAIGRSINLGGQTALALRLLLAAMSSRISSSKNRPFGDEFRAARKAAEEVGAQIVLGDRPIEITLERAWTSLSWTEKLNLVTSAVKGISSSSDNPKDESKDTIPDDVSPFQLYEKLSLSYPSLLQPLIHERDTYLAWSLKRSKAVKKSKRVVGVIGKGHLNGVIYALISDQGNLRFRDVAGKSSTGSGSKTWAARLADSLIRDTVIGIVLWALYELIKSGLEQYMPS
ncbi:hypothetical protein V2J09_021253 [Rumex salicifolius]